MSLRLKLMALPAVLLLGSCSIPPQVEQLAGFQTIEIVDRIKCEARTAIQRETIDLLRSEPINEANWILANYLEEAPDHWQTQDIERHLSTADQRFFYYRYIESGIALDFTFDLAESNKNSTEIDLLKAVSKGAVGLNFVASDEHKRANRRQFLISETFGHLLDNLAACFPPTYDTSRRSQNFGIPNPIAPISGYINIRETIHTFIQINREGLLQKKKDDAAPTLANTLIFTTTYIGSINPTIAISPIGRTFDFKLASLTGQATRSDVNQVLIGLSLNPKNASRPVVTSTTSFARPFAAGLGANAFARKTIKPSEQRAINAVTQQKIDTFFERSDIFR